MLRLRPSPRAGGPGEGRAVRSAAAMCVLPEPAGERPTAPEARAEVAADLLADPRAIWPPQLGGRPGLFIMGGRTQSLPRFPIPVSPGYFVPAAQTIFNLYPLPWRHREAGGCQEQAPVQRTAAGSCFPRSRWSAAVPGEAVSFRPRPAHGGGPRALPGVPCGAWPRPGSRPRAGASGVQPLLCKPHDRSRGGRRGAGSRRCLPVPSRGHGGARRPRALRSPAKAEMKASSANAPGVCLAPVSPFLPRRLSPVGAGSGVAGSRGAELSLGPRVDPGPRADSEPSRASLALCWKPPRGARPWRPRGPPHPPKSDRGDAGNVTSALSAEQRGRHSPSGARRPPFLSIPHSSSFPSLPSQFPFPFLSLASSRGATPTAHSAECIVLLNQAWIFKA